MSYPLIQIHSVTLTLFAVESGITIKDLNEELDKRGLALANMGAYDGQTLAGAISTGTHGTGLGLGPIASSVRAITLVSSSGKIYQIEPSNGISDPAKFQPGPNNIVLKQDDNWFHTATVAMGCVGIIYSYIIAVVPAFYLQEFRTLNTWESLKPKLALGPQSPVLTDNFSYEIDINPYPEPITKQHLAIEITHNVPVEPLARGSRGFAYWLDGVLASFKWAEKILVWVCNEFPKRVPGIIDQALRTMQSVDHMIGYTDKSFHVMSVGNVDNVQAFALELSLPVDENLVARIEDLLGLLDRAAKEKGWYMAGPLALRFVAASDAFLAPQAGRATCMAELDMLVGINNSHALLKYVKQEMCKPGNGVRVHWGLDLDTVTGADVENMYPEWPKWFEVYKELNNDGMWNSVFTDRLEISVNGGSRS